MFTHGFQMLRHLKFLRPKGSHCPPGVPLLDLDSLHSHLQRLAASLSAFQLQFLPDRRLERVEGRLFLARIIIGVVGPTGQTSGAVSEFLGLSLSVGWPVPVAQCSVLVRHFLPLQQSDKIHYRSSLLYCPSTAYSSN